MHLSKLFVTCLILTSAVQAQDLKIGIWRDGTPTQRFLIHSEHEMKWLADGKQSFSIPAGSSTYFTFENDLIRLSTAKKTLGRFKTVRSVEMLEKHYNMQCIRPKRREDIYSQDLVVKVEAQGLMILNVVSDLDEYISGVVESESGKEQGLEYYKVQSVISRTYALSNQRRHEHEGFNLCDQVHCQVYHGVSRHNPLIIEAARNTSDQVLVDSHIDLITASYHSNCGGHTVNSEDVWSKALPYLRARPDTFCVHGKHAEWETRIPRADWESHLKNSFDSEHNPREYPKGPNNPGLREAYYLAPELGIELKKLRSHWKLNSTLFEIVPEGSDLILKGRGFGHGVGLCQEGAMIMARMGYSYEEIMHFYYTDVHLTHRSVIDFFKED